MLMTSIRPCIFTVPSNPQGRRRLRERASRIVMVCTIQFLLARFGSAEETVEFKLTIHDTSSANLLFDLTGGTPQKWSLETTPQSFKLYDYENGGGKTPFVVERAARHRALVLSSNGKIGMGTGSFEEPAADLHIRADSVPSLLLEQSGENQGEPQQAWLLRGDHSQFELMDANTSDTPFIVSKGAPIYSLVVSPNGSAGIGTPATNLIGSVSTAGNSRHLNLDAGTGIARSIVQGQLGAEVYMVHKGGLTNRKIVRFGVSGGKYRVACLTDNLQGNTEAAAFCIDMATTNVGIKTPNPMKPLQVGDAGANDGNGAHVTAGGVWTNASSRSVKNSITPITSEQAREAVRKLQPVGYRYNNEPDENYVGFIAEDVPELVATKDRKSLAPMDVVAVLTKVVQEQDTELAAEREKNTEQQKLIAELSKRLLKLEQKLAE